MSGWGPLFSRGFQPPWLLRVQGARHRLGWRTGEAEKDAAVTGGMDVLVPRPKSALEPGGKDSASVLV